MIMTGAILYDIIDYQNQIDNSFTEYLHMPIICQGRENTQNYLHNQIKVAGSFRQPLFIKTITLFRYPGNVLQQYCIAIFDYSSISFPSFADLYIPFSIFWTFTPSSAVEIGSFPSFMQSRICLISLAKGFSFSTIGDESIRKF